MDARDVIRAGLGLTWRYGNVHSGRAELFCCWHETGGIQHGGVEDFECVQREEKVACEGRHVWEGIWDRICMFCSRQGISEI